jgi:hypothetical protein
VLYGNANNPQFTIKDGLLQTHYQRVVGKVGLDSAAGWVATVDGASGNVFVQRARYEADAEYPDGASVEIWTNGLGDLTAYGRTEQMSEDPDVNPYVLESELLSPYAHLAPGESAEFIYDWYAANIGVKADQSYPVLDCSNAGCVVEPFTISGEGQLRGRFGIFHEGYAAIEFLQADGTCASLSTRLTQVSPLLPLILGGHVCVPEKAYSAVLALYGRDGDSMGELARIMIQHDRAGESLL